MSSFVQSRTDFRVLLINYNSSDYDARAIQQRLIDHYWTLVKSRQPSEEETEDAWFQGDRSGSVPFATLRKIERRAQLYQERKRSLVGLDHLKKDERDHLKKLLGGVRASYMNEATADLLAAALHDKFPWLAAATDRVWLQMRRAAREERPVRVGPLLLNGPPGIGKSAWSRALARALETPHLTIDAAASGAGFAVAGTERGWSSAQPGRPIEVIMQHRHAGPMIIVDEVCKAAIGHSAKGGRQSIQDAMLGLLEPVSAKEWECPFYRVSFDLSAISWILTSNYLDLVPEPLRTRCDVVECPNLTPTQLMVVAERIGEKASLSPPAIDAALTAIEHTYNGMPRSMNVRDVSRIIDRAAALETKPLFH
jgi:hypothetical protein